MEEKSILEVLIQTAEGDIFDISELVTALSFADSINVSGIVTLSVMKDAGLKITEGNRVRVKYDGEMYFLGFVFKLDFSEDAEVKITAYDQLRYLKAKATYVFDDITASDALRQICAEFSLKTGEIADTKFKLASMIFDDKVILDTVSDCLTATLRGTNQLFFIKDNVGCIELKNIRETIQDFVIDPECTLLGYSYSRSIDSDSYNLIKLVRDNKDSGQREEYIARDPNNIRLWGLLQYYEKSDDGLSESQIKAKVDGLLALKNRVLKSLTDVEVLGDRRLRAGNMIFVNLHERGLSGFLLCTKANHTFTNAAHIVKADFKLI